MCHSAEAALRLPSLDTHAFNYTHATYKWSANVMDTTWVSDDVRLPCDNNCGEELPPIVKQTREELHGALAIAIDLLENL